MNFAHPNLCESCGQLDHKKTEEEGQTVFYYCSHKKTWLQNKEKCPSYQGETNFIDVAIITTTEIERTAIKKHFRNVSVWETREHNGQRSWQTNFSIDQPKGSLRIALVQSPLMGLPAAATTATKLCYLYDPSLLIMGGITAGNPADTHYGDIVVPRQLFDYGAGKWDGDRFIPNADPFPIHQEVLCLCREIADDESFLNRNKTEWSGPTPNDRIAPKVITERVAVSGAAVISQTGIWETLKNRNKDIVALDMEAFAIQYVAAQVPTEYPKVLIAKSVCDYARDKNDSAQPYAAYTSARFIEEFINRYAKQLLGS